MLKKAKHIMNHERYQIVTIIVVIGFMIYLQGCPSTCPSMITDNHRVTRNELKAEVDLLLARAGERIRTLDQQDAFKKLIAENALLFTASGTVNPVGLMTVAFSILGIGATVDNIRRRKDEKKTLVTAPVS
jgi:hypothetical protein